MQTADGYAQNARECNTPPSMRARDWHAPAPLRLVGRYALRCGRASARKPAVTMRFAQTLHNA
jgi:hypothetical protein